jgi:DNA-binding NtrC family response regulator
MKHRSILLVDDDKGVLRTLAMILGDHFSSIKSVSNPNQIPAELNQHKYDLVLLDMNFSAGVNSGNEGLYWLRQIKDLSDNTEVVLITAYGDIDLAVKGMKQGAADFVVKPWENKRLISTLEASLQLKAAKDKIQKLDKQNKTLRAETNRQATHIVAESKAMKQVLELVKRVAPTDANVLITGENGTGKEVIAREIHRLSERSAKQFIPVDLGSLTATLFESELFGHKKGAFTDAQTDRQGRFMAADEGTLFLDEIGNIPMALQTKLLTVLQNKEVLPLGATQKETTNARVLCATNTNLQKAIQEEQFREDLYFRINTIEIAIPPLRERKEDIRPLARYFLNLYTKRYQKTSLVFEDEAEKALQNYRWPGNVRELSHAIERAVILADGSSIKASDLQFHSQQAPEEDPADDWPLTFEEIEKMAIKRALKNNKGVLIEAARELGITRQTIYNKIKKYNLSAEK